MKKNKLYEDISGGTLGAIVALPQALAFGVAVGIGASSGIWGAIILCLIVGLIGCNHPTISGPTGPVAIVIASTIATMHGDINTLWAIIFLAGLFQIIISRTSLTDVIKYVPYPVISGFMNAIGVILILLQISPFLGQESYATVEFALQNLSYTITNIDEKSLTIGLLAIGIMIYTPRSVSKRIPSQIIAILVCTILAHTYSMDIPTVEGVTSKLPQIISADFSNLKNIIVPAIIIAVICSSESLLTTLVVDSLTRKTTNTKRHILAQGVGNLVCSLFGAMPGAAATVRSAAAIKAGGRTRLSAIFCALILLLFVLFAHDLVNKIPLATLAAILFMVGVSIVDTKLLKVIKYAPKEDLLIMCCVFFLTIFYDIITGATAGLILSALMFSKKLADKAGVIVKEVEDQNAIKLEDELQDELGYQIRVVHIHGELFFGSATQIISHFEEILETKYLIICYESKTALDISAIFALEDIITRLKAQKIIPHLVLHSDEIYEQLDNLNILEQIGKDNIFYHEDEAIEHAKKMLSSQSAKLKRWLKRFF